MPVILYQHEQYVKIPVNPKVGQANNNLGIDVNALSLDLLSEKWGNEKVSQLIITVGQVGRIQFLSLADNELTDAIVPYICLHLINNPSVSANLRNLDLGSNQISDAGARKILEALQKSVREGKNIPDAIELGNNEEISEDTLNLIENFVSENKKNRLDSPR